LRLLHLVDVVSGVETTVKVEKVTQSCGEGELNIHQIEGNYLTLDDFDKAWDRDYQRNVLVNFISVSLLDGRKLINALLEEIR
jgi:hypothetical protein